MTRCSAKICSTVANSAPSASSTPSLKVPRERPIPRRKSLEFRPSVCCAIRACPIRPISQISYLLFLKTDEERVTQIGEASMLPEGARWGDIRDLSGEALNAAYVRLLDRLSK